MSSLSLIFFETGLNLKIPDLKKIPAANFPVWGSFYFLSCALSNYSPFADIRRLLVLDEEYRSVQGFVLNRWKREIPEIIILTHDSSPLLDTLEAMDSDKVILSSLSYIAFFEKEHLFRVVSKCSDNILKISIDGIPVDLFLADRRHLINVIRSYQARYSIHGYFGSILFQDILHNSFDIIEDIPGAFFLQNNLTQLYRENLALAEIQKMDRMLDILKDLSVFTNEESLSTIGEKAFVKQSFIAGGVDIRGHIENSIIFPGVCVKTKTKIINSVIMNDNQIGSNVEISNAMIFPNYKEIMKGGSNIEDNSIIGAAPPSMEKNKDFPDQIRDGLTVVGVNADVPRGAVIEQGCYLGCNVPSHELKKQKGLKNGNTLIRGNKP